MTHNGFVCVAVKPLAPSHTLSPLRVRGEKQCRYI